jgi:hypothetical protein
MDDIVILELMRSQLALQLAILLLAHLQLSLGERAFRGVIELFCFTIWYDLGLFRRAGENWSGNGSLMLYEYQGRLASIFAFVSLSFHPYLL